MARIFARKTYMIYLCGKPLDVTIFPDKTSQVWKIPDVILKVMKLGVISVKWEFESEAEFMHLAQLKALLDQTYDSIPKSLYIKYLPYARQDKQVANDATFALRPFASLLNSLHFDEVIIDDPHSEIALLLIEDSRAVYPVNEVESVWSSTRSSVVCYPDKGALTKYKKIYEYPFIYGEKVRDQLTGNITSYKVVGDPKDKRVLIVDDLCDGGMTFKILAKDLLAAGALEVNLFVSHGIFSKGIKTLKDSGIKHVFTKDGEAFAAEYPFVNDVIYKDF